MLTWLGIVTIGVPMVRPSFEAMLYMWLAITVPPAPGIACTMIFGWPGK